MTKMLNTKAFEQYLKAQAELIVRYRQVEKSEILATYYELKKVVESAEFKENKENCRKTLLGKWRWRSTTECQQEKQFAALAKNVEILLFESYKEEVIAELESYKSVWAEEFDGNTISTNWQTGHLYGNAALQANHSHVAELQAYTEGKNTKIGASVLSIVTKKQKNTAAAWHPTKGMHMHTFAYTSDIWHTAQAVVPTSGVLQAKVRCAGKAKQVLSLTTAGAKTSIPVLHTDKAPKGYAIYTLVWNEKEVISYVNNIEVARDKNPFAGKELHIALRSYLPENQKAGSGQMDIDWIRIYTQK